MRRTPSRLCCFLFAAACFAFVAMQPAAQSLPAPATPPELIVLLDEFADPDRLSPEAAVDQIAGRRRDLVELQRRLQWPQSARFMIEDQRLDPEERRARPVDNVEARLHRYLVLGYPDDVTTEQARDALSRDPWVESVGRNGIVPYAMTPGDPYHAKKQPVASNTLAFQWAHHEFPHGSGHLSLNLQQAWDKVRGTAYIGHVDFGIQVGHPDLSGSFRPQFAYNAASNNSEIDEGYANATTHRGHGTHTAGILAANTHYPGVKSGYPGYPAEGVAGTCLWCSLIVVKNSNSPFGSNFAAYASALYWAARRGAQVINLSSGIPRGPLFFNLQCGHQDLQSICDSIEYAFETDTVIVAAAGNSGHENIAFPANEDGMVAAGATKYGTTSIDPTKSDHGSEMQDHGVAAPGQDVLSTTYTGFTWYEPIRCGDGESGGPAGAGYGGCTGTSMSTPFISGVVALMRTVNPMLKRSEVIDHLFDTAVPIAGRSHYFGHGIINANSAVTSVLATTNRLTPLFSMKALHQGDHFYTVVPHQARAAYMGTLLPQVQPPLAVPGATSYDFIGNSVKQGGATYKINSGGGGNLTPKAQVWIFTTHNNPKNPSRELLPLYRLSYKCGDPIPSGRPNVCQTYPKHVDHFYTTDIETLLEYAATHGYRPDGIEGYLYPPSEPMPAGAIALVSAYHPAIDDYAVFPASMLTSMQASGYSKNVVTLGYAYANPASGQRPGL